MKKIFDIQLFADEPSDSAATAASGTDTKPTENNDADKQDNKPGRETKAEPKYTDADLDRIIGRKFAELEKKKQKEVDEAKKLAEMNAEQKANYERDKAIEERDEAIRERDELKKAASLAEMAKTARKMLADENINVSDELLAMLVTTDAEQTKTAIDNFAKLFKDSVESVVKERLRGETPRRGTGSDTPVTEIEKRIKKYS